MIKKDIVIVRICRDILNVTEEVTPYYCVKSFSWLLNIGEDLIREVYKKLANEGLLYKKNQKFYLVSKKDKATEILDTIASALAQDLELATKIDHSKALKRILIK